MAARNGSNAADPKALQKKLSSLARNAASQETSILPLIPAVKDYAWGIRGMDSRVARYGLESGAIEQIQVSAPYAGPLRLRARCHCRRE